MRSFMVIWVGQMFSLLGTSMSGFGLTVWAYELTGKATALALVGFFFVTPMLIVSPLAGALVDRSNRKLMMMLSDLSSGIATISILALYLAGNLQIWHLYVANAFMGTFQAFQWPAFSAAITTMLPKEQYGRANGLMSLTETGPDILAPIMAGALLGVIGLGGILTIDLVTLSIAILTLLTGARPPAARQPDRPGEPRQPVERNDLRLFFYSEASRPAGVADRLLAGQFLSTASPLRFSRR